MKNETLIGLFVALLIVAIIVHKQAGGSTTPPAPTAPVVSVTQH